MRSVVSCYDRASSNLPGDYVRSTLRLNSSDRGSTPLISTDSPPDANPGGFSFGLQNRKSRTAANIAVFLSP